MNGYILFLNELTYIYRYIANFFVSHFWISFSFSPWPPPPKKKKSAKSQELYYDLQTAWVSQVTDIYAPIPHH